MSAKNTKTQVLEKNVIDDKSCFRKVRLENEVYNVTSIFNGEQELKDILHRIAIKRIERTN